MSLLTYWTTCTKHEDCDVVVVGPEYEYRVGPQVLWTDHSPCVHLALAAILLQCSVAASRMKVCVGRQHIRCVMSNVYRYLDG